MNGDEPGATASSATGRGHPAIGAAAVVVLALAALLLAGLGWAGLVATMVIVAGGVAASAYLGGRPGTGGAAQHPDGAPPAGP